MDTCPIELQQEMLWELGQVEIGVGTLVTTNVHIGESDSTKY